jgi:hypothetical protein
MSRDFPGIDFRRLSLSLSLSLSRVRVLHIYLDLNLRSFSSPAFSSFWGSQKNPKTHEIADPNPQLRHQGHRNPNDKSSAWIRWSKFLSCRRHAFAALPRPRVSLFPVIVGEPATFVDEVKMDEEKTRQGATSSSRCMIAVVRMDG